ncbi:MAG: FGGY family carbohydrate kinase [Bacillota bacterium]|nr:FGGY family carbohydrate kinase [Bacillota bacterium]
MNLLGIDVGTTSLKAAAFNDKGEILFSATIDYTLITKGDIAEFDAKEYWEICKKGIKEASNNITIDALAIDTQCETLILTDGEGTPVYNAIVWLDNRATKEAEEIKSFFQNKKVYEITGQPEVTATWPACKILWIKKNLPEVFSRVKKIFLLEDWLLYKLTGEFVTEKTLQSSSLYFDINKADWWDEMLDYIGITRNMLPQLKNSAEVIGKSGGITVVTGAIDQIAGAIGAGVVKKGIVSEMTGTTMVIFVPCDKVPSYNPKSIVPCHYNYDGKYTLLSWTPTAGMALKWFKNNFCENFSFKELDMLAKEVSPGSCGLVFLPYLCGSTMPKYNPDSRGVFAGLTLEHGRPHFIRAILESVACMLKENLDYLGIDAKEIRTMGGGADSPLWCQIKADITGKRLVTLKNKETACLGSAILAGVGIKAFNSVEEACDSLISTDKIYSPDGSDYNFIYTKYCDIDNLICKED